MQQKKSNSTLVNAFLQEYKQLSIEGLLGQACEIFLPFSQFTSSHSILMVLHISCHFFFPVPKEETFSELSISVKWKGIFSSYYSYVRNKV